MKEKTIIASWVIHLFSDCPHCGEDVDLLDYCDFWDGVGFEIGEWGTSRTRGVDVICPECGESYNCDFVY